MLDQAVWKERRSGEILTRTRDPRTAYDRDLARITHAPSFRRLQSKTQVLGLGESDFYRTRLTHSVEVAQIAAGIKRYLENAQQPREAVSFLPSVPLITAVALAHDIGHPPFGHGGEIALNYMMTGHGGFEGNAQSLRILSRLEGRTKDYGLDLTRRALLGVLKYPVTYSTVVAVSQKQHGQANQRSRFDTNFRTVQSREWKPPKCYYDQDTSLVDWILSPVNESDRQIFVACDPPDENRHGRSRNKSLDTTIMDLSDDISYGVHDLEDAIHMGFITHDNGGSDAIASLLESADSNWVNEFDLNGIEDALFSDKWIRKEAIGRLVNAFICSAFLQKDGGFDAPLLRWRVALLPEAEPLLKGLKSLVVDEVIKSPQVQTLEYRGQQVTMELFQALASDPERLLPQDTKIKWLEQNDDEHRLRVVCDHISGMTDDYAARIYERLFLPRAGSLFQKM